MLQKNEATNKIKCIKTKYSNTNLSIGLPLLFLWALHLGTFGGRNGKKGTINKNGGEKVAVRPKPKF